MKENVIFFGASRLGKIAKELLGDKYNIVSYCDNDPSKWGTTFEGIKVISPQQLDGNTKIIVTSVYFQEILQQLANMGFWNIKVFSAWVNNYTDTLVESFNIREINLGKFLENSNVRQIDDVTLMRGGSALLDYLFLKAIISIFHCQTYLEIGTFTGESIAAVSDLVRKCYSISLPDDDLEPFFRKMGKANFSRFFSNKKTNVVYYPTDSKFFDYRQIDDHIDLVFIDGDHRYEGVLIDTKKVFQFIDPEKTIVVWHDFKQQGKYRMETVKAVFDALPKEIHNNIFAVDNNMCGVYVPDRYLNKFELAKEQDELYSYEVKIKIKLNRKKV